MLWGSGFVVECIYFSLLYATILGDVIGAIVTIHATPIKKLRCVVKKDPRKKSLTESSLQPM